jgi:hypothetical protein
LRFQLHPGRWGCFQMQQRRIADGLGHLQPMLIHRDWTFAQFRRRISKANIRGSTALRKSMSGRSEEWVPSPEPTAAALEVSALPADGLRIQEILSQGSWKLHEASDCFETLALSRDESAPVLPCEPDYADGNWDDLLNATASLPAPPNLNCVLSSGRGVLLGEGAESGWFRRADDAFRAGGGVASRFLFLEPVGVRLCCELR